MSKNLKLVLFFTVAVALAVTGYLYNETKNAANTLENTPSVPVAETNVIDNAVPVATEVPTEVVAPATTPEVKTAVVAPATTPEVKTEVISAKKENVKTKK